MEVLLNQPFGSVCDLIPAAEQVIKLNAVCTNCGADAGAWVL
jgi:thymidine kinase